VRRHLKRDAAISSSFASAETSIPKEAIGFAKWHLDSHFWSIFASFCLLAIPQSKNRILIQDKNRAAAANWGLAAFAKSLVACVEPGGHVFFSRL
jgi:hypothetical protein